jgi:cytochrome c oxidase cbb3-type subunit 3
VYSADAAILEKGKVVFNNNCVACHRADGGGNTIGPNLTDEYWIHGGGIKNVFSTIKNGKVDKGMPEWGKAMSAQDVRDVAFFVMSLKGTNPANGKAPQGELYKPDENVKVMSDSTQASL